MYEQKRTRPRRQLGLTPAEERQEEREIEALKWNRWVAVATLATTAVTLGTLVWALVRDTNRDA